MAVSPDDLLDRIVEGFEERIGHFDNGCRYNLLLLALEQLLLLMSQDLYLFEVRLTGALPEHTLVLATRPAGHVTHRSVIEGSGRQIVRLVVLNLKIEALERIKLLQVVEVSRWVGLDLLKEGRNVGLVLQRQLQHGLANRVLVEVKRELHIGDIVLGGAIIDQSRVLGLLEVFGNLRAHVLSRANAAGFDPGFEFA